MGSHRKLWFILIAVLVFIVGAVSVVLQVVLGLRGRTPAIAEETG